MAEVNKEVYSARLEIVLRNFLFIGDKLVSYYSKEIYAFVTQIFFSVFLY